MRAILTALTLCVGLMACTEAEQAINDVARTSAKSAIDEVLVTRFPNVNAQNVTPYTDCVIDNATAGEITALARDAVIGVDDGTLELVLEIARRPETLQCLATLSLPSFLQ